MSRTEKVTRYTAQDVVEMEEGSALRVTIGGKELLLPALTIGDETIFIFNPSERDVQLAGKVALVELLKKSPHLEARKQSSAYRVLTPQSSKSTEMIIAATNALQQKTGREFRLDSFMLLKASSRKELEKKLGKNAFIVDYSPITKKSSFMGISEENAWILRNEHGQGIQFLQLDDVISTGSTIRAIEMLLAKILKDPQAAASVPVFAVAREIQEIRSTEDDPETWSYSIIIPVLEAFSHDE